MGAGASAQVKEQLASAKAEELQQAIAGLSDESRARLVQALDGSSSNVAPYIKEYFQVVSDMMKEMMKSPDEMMEMMMDPEKAAAAEQKMKEALAKLPALAEKSFDHHDKDKSGVLDKDESAVFFKNFVSENASFTVCLGEMSMKTCLKAFDKAMKDAEAQMKINLGVDMPEEKKEEARKEMKEKITASIKAIKEKVDSIQKDYIANKKEKDEAAFKIIDVGGDGKLQRSEFVSALTPETEKNDEFMKAIGIDIESIGAFDL